MPVQKEFDWQRSTKLWMLERIRCSGQVKSVLKAVDGFARDNASATVTLKLLAQSMGVSQDSARRYVKAAEKAAYLIVDRTNKSASTYFIQWLPIFDQTHSKTGASGDQNNSSEAVATSETTPWQTARPPLQIAGGPPCNLQAPPLQVARGAPPPTINDKFTSRPWRGKAASSGNSGQSQESHAEKIQGYRAALNAREKAKGGRVFEPRKDEPVPLGTLFDQLLTSSPDQNSGQRESSKTIPAWTGHVELRDLHDVPHLQVLARRAAAAKLIPPGRDGVVIVLAAAHHARNASDVKNACGLFKSIVEGKSRFRLNAGDFEHARQVLREVTTPQLCGRE